MNPHEIFCPNVACPAKGQVGIAAQPTGIWLAMVVNLRRIHRHQVALRRQAAKSAANNGSGDALAAFFRRIRDGFGKPTDALYCFSNPLFA